VRRVENPGTWCKVYVYDCVGDVEWRLMEGGKERGGEGEEEEKE
jgi:hypothetical protein